MLLPDRTYKRGYSVENGFLETVHYRELCGYRDLICFRLYRKLVAWLERLGLFQYAS